MLNEAKQKTESEENAAKYYRALVKKFHGDKNQNNDLDKYYKEMMQKVNSIKGNEKALQKMYSEFKKGPEKPVEKVETKPKGNRKSSESAYRYEGFKPNQKKNKFADKVRETLKKKKKSHGDYRDSDVFSNQKVNRRK